MRAYKSKLREEAVNTDRRIRRRSCSCRFDPPESFPGDIVRYHGVRTDRPSDAEPPEGPLFYGTMDDETTRSYLTWRGRVADRIEAAPH